MTQYNSPNLKLPNSKLNKLKSEIKNEADVVLRLSSNMTGNSDNETNFPHKLLENFGELLLTTYQLILNCQKLNYLR